jgi:hypothetical protein
MIGPAQLRLRLEHRRDEFSAKYTREAEVWLLEQDAKVAAIEACPPLATKRNSFLCTLRWRLALSIKKIRRLAI